MILIFRRKAILRTSPTRSTPFINPRRDSSGRQLPQELAESPLIVGSGLLFSLVRGTSFPVDRPDATATQPEMMALYRAEKVNPASGCLPIVIQIPVFFSLYKVIFVTIEMRQAPFFGWIKDLSVVDPTNIFNLFGLIPFDPAVLTPYLHMGAWPLLMGVTMFLQQKLNPPPPDPVGLRPASGRHRDEGRRGGEADRPFDPKTIRATEERQDERQARGRAAGTGYFRGAVEGLMGFAGVGAAGRVAGASAKSTSMTAE